MIISHYTKTRAKKPTILDSYLAPVARGQSFLVTKSATDVITRDLNRPHFLLDSYSFCSFLYNAEFIRLYVCVSFQKDVGKLEINFA